MIVEMESHKFEVKVQPLMTDSTKGFLQVYEDTTDKAAIVKSISYYFCEAYKTKSKIS